MTDFQTRFLETKTVSLTKDLPPLELQQTPGDFYVGNAWSYPHAVYDRDASEDELSFQCRLGWKYEDAAWNGNWEKDADGRWQGGGRRNPSVFRQVPYYEIPLFCPGSPN